MIDISMVKRVPFLSKPAHATTALHSHDFTSSSGRAPRGPGPDSSGKNGTRKTQWLVLLSGTLWLSAAAANFAKWRSESDFRYSRVKSGAAMYL